MLIRLACETIAKQPLNETHQLFIIGEYITDESFPVRRRLIKAEPVYRRMHTQIFTWLTISAGAGSQIDHSVIGAKDQGVPIPFIADQRKRWLRLTPPYDIFHMAPATQRARDDP